MADDRLSCDRSAPFYPHLFTYFNTYYQSTAKQLLKRRPGHEWAEIERICNSDFLSSNR
ncbi:MAG: hypothetical protein HC895_20930 [Leptolyngbyaceae cyanobacterium SM1_3_5]|nr:hypothetical protein [Leptolyngbyaceae cyanobacterium SM1_3_5]